MHGQTVSGFQPPVLPTTGSLAGSASGTGSRSVGGTQGARVLSEQKHQEGGFHTQEDHSSLRAVARSNCGSGEVGGMRVQAREAAPPYRVGAVADQTGQHVQIDQGEQWNVRSAAALRNRR